MNELDTFTLFLSWKCNFLCAHCGFSCGPERHEKIELETAKNYIEEASLNKSLKMVAYSGGEPFLFLEEMKELMAFSYNKGLRAGVVTNCFWAESEQIAVELLSELKGLGLDEVITSLDDYHLKYVDLRNINNVVKAAVSLGIVVGINILMTSDSRIRKETINELLDLPKALLEDPRRVWVRESSPIRVGRAKEFFHQDKLKLYGEMELKHNPCYFVIRNVVITPDGSTYACCGFGGASRNGPSSITMGGNINDRCLSELYDDFKKDLLLNIISVKGPYVLLMMVQETNPEIKFRKQYVSNCDICEEISTNIPLRNALQNLLSEIASKLGETISIKRDESQNDL